MLSTARRLYRLSRESKKPDAEREPGYQERDLKRFEEGMTRIDRRFDPDVDRAILRRFILIYSMLDADQRVRRDWEAINAKLGGATQVRILLDSDLPDGILEPATLRGDNIDRSFRSARPRLTPCGEAFLRRSGWTNFSG